MSTEIQSKVKVNEPLNLKASFLESYYDKDHELVYYKWKGHISAEEGKWGMEKIADIVKKAKTQFVVADLTEFKGGTVDISKWVNDVWSDMMYKAGIRYFAIKFPESAFGQFSNKMAMGEKAVSLFTIEQFTSFDNAYNWFKTKRSEASKS